MLCLPTIDHARKSRLDHFPIMYGDVSCEKFRLAVVLLAGLFAVSISAAGQAPENPGASKVQIHSFLPDKPIARAQRPAELAAVIENLDRAEIEIDPKLMAPEGIKILEPVPGLTPIEGLTEQVLKWTIVAQEATSYELTLNVESGGVAAARASLHMDFLTAREVKKLPYIPEPKPVQTSLIVGAHHCPLWEADKPNMWSQLLIHPERTPALGFYAQDNPEVSDWETKWASEHGVSFFIYCWYRISQGEPVKTQFSSAIHEGLFKSKFADTMKFTIMWENQSRGRAGVADENDLMTNLLPFWMENYFKHSSYLKIDNKPVLFIYRPEFLVDDLGGVEKVVQAFQHMREACQAAGFAGLYLLGEYRGLDPEHLKLMKSLGLDYTFAYCWYVPDNPTPAQAIDAQMGYIQKTQALGILPQVVTVSQAWSGWRDEGTIWKIPPAEYKTLLQKAKEIVATFPAQELGSKLLLLDNWNEWGEGHYIAPYREYGFGYLDAVREVFSGDTAPHDDLIPEDIGMGPYDSAYRNWTEKEREARNQARKAK